MPTFVALLRGINVGKAKRLPMAELRALLSELGYTDVVTLLNSGNAVFRTAEGATKSDSGSQGTGTQSSPAQLAEDIAAAISARMRFDVPVIVKSATELAAIASQNPLADAAANPSQLLVVFVQDPGTLVELEGIAPLVEPPEQFVIGEHAAYLHCPNGILESKAGETLLRKAQATTTRNWATVLKILSKAGI